MASRKEQKAAARERLRQEMEQRQRRARRNRVIGITAGVAVLIVAAVSIGIFVQNERDKEAAARAEDKNSTPAKINDDGLSIRVGKQDAPVTLTVYEDFRCPACKQFEENYGKSIDKLVAEGKLKVDYHIATIIDANIPNTHGSKVAGNAAVCANEVGKFKPYHDVLFDNQPPESYDGFTTDQVLKLAGNVDGLAGNEQFESCVRADKYRNWLRKVQSAFDKKFQGRVATPSLLLDGKVMLGGQQQQMAQEMSSPTVFEQTVNQLAAKENGGESSGRPRADTAKP